MSENTDKQLAKVDEVYRCFFPRGNWASGNWRDNQNTIAIALRLWKLVEVGELQIVYSSVPDHTYDGRRYRFYEPGNEDLYMREIYAAVNSRRGKSDLKDEMWTAYNYLQGKYPGEQLQSYYRGLPFIYTSPDASEGVTAGNVEPDLMLRWMAQMKMTTLHVIGVYYGIPEGEAPYQHRPEGMTGMVSLNFSEAALSFISEYFEERCRKLLELLGLPDELFRNGDDPMDYMSALYPIRKA